jgi:hypothetical protein
MGVYSTKTNIINFQLSWTLLSLRRDGVRIGISIFILLIIILTLDLLLHRSWNIPYIQTSVIIELLQTIYNNNNIYNYIYIYGLYISFLWLRTP